MAGSRDTMDEAALWRRWRSAAASAMTAGAEPNPLVLAAYAENRLPPHAVEAVEDWLAAHPEALQDVLAARQAAREALPAASPAVLARAAALVVEGNAQVLPFRHPATRVTSWRGAIAWGALAASLLVTSLVGFTLGSDAYVSLARSTSPALGHELLDPPMGLFHSLDEESST